MYNEKQDVLNTLKKLGYSVVDISNATDIPTPRIYKWYKGEGLPKLADFNKLKKMIEESRSPTSDFHGGMPQLNEPEIPMLPKYWADQFDRLEKLAEERRQHIEALRMNIDILKKKIEQFEEAKANSIAKQKSA